MRTRGGGPGGPSGVQALDLGAAVCVPGLRAGSDVVAGALLADADPPLPHRQERVHSIDRGRQEAKYHGSNFRSGSVV